MSDWLNWSDYAEGMKPEVQRQADMASQQNDAARAQMTTALNGLSSQAFNRADAGTFGGVQQLSGYGDVMKQREAAKQAAAPREAAPWEADLKGGAGVHEQASPWDELDTRLGSIGNRAGQRNTTIRNDQADAAAKKARDQYNEDQKRRALDQQQSWRDSEAGRYAKWSDSVNRDAERNGGAGAGAWYDAAEKPGSAQPVQQFQTPRTQKIQRAVFQQPQIMPRSTTSGFGENSGYSGRGSWF